MESAAESVEPEAPAHSGGRVRFSFDRNAPLSLGLPSEPHSPLLSMDESGEGVGVAVNYEGELAPSQTSSREKVKEGDKEVTG